MEVTLFVNVFVAVVDDETLVFSTGDGDGVILVDSRPFMGLTLSSITGDGTFEIADSLLLTGISSFTDGISTALVGAGGATLSSVAESTTTGASGAPSSLPPAKTASRPAAPAAAAKAVFRSTPPNKSPAFGKLYCTFDFFLSPSGIFRFTFFRSTSFTFFTVFLAVVPTVAPKFRTALFSRSFNSATCRLFKSAAFAFNSLFNFELLSFSFAARSEDGMEDIAVFVALTAPDRTSDGTSITGSTPACGSNFFALSASSFARRWASSRLALAETRPKRSAARATRDAAGSAAASANGPAAAVMPSTFGLGREIDGAVADGRFGLGREMVGAVTDGRLGVLRGALLNVRFVRFVVPPLINFSVSDASMLS
mmetsp:Transcript_16496/g.28298  ORF Transcript_16496/g.28298 Transcript_16496/m.28298 type:complete len:369 (+) Transcript_16496:1107-2213(+)